MSETLSTKIIIARHGNTFNPDETPRRIGRRSDLPLVGSGVDQAKKIGHYLAANKIIPDFIFSGTLQRSFDTAQIIANTIKLNSSVLKLEKFNEIDHGPDENQTEDLVVKRLGSASLERWNKYGEIPDGWLANKDDLISIWTSFAKECLDTRPLKTTLVVTSNGLAKFALNLVSALDQFPPDFNPKLGTGCLGIFEFRESVWKCKWNIKP